MEVNAIVRQRYPQRDPVWRKIRVVHPPWRWRIAKESIDQVQSGGDLGGNCGGGALSDVYHHIANTCALHNGLLSSTSKILLISQAPGQVAHLKSLAWDDAGGKRLKAWLNVTEKEFYTTENFAIFPMAFCYPGKAKIGDLPPRPECAPLWHGKVLSKLKTQPLKILIGNYAQNYYLNDKKTLTERVKNYSSYLPNYLPLPHPSPLNRFWMQKNPWFQEEIIPLLQRKIHAMLR